MFVEVNRRRSKQETW